MASHHRTIRILFFTLALSLIVFTFRSGKVPAAMSVQAQNRGASNVVPAAAWSPLTAVVPGDLTNCLLLTDARVMCQRSGTNQWFALTPDSSGGYVSGTWSQLASMQSGYYPIYFASAVLADGRVIVEGGEYNCDSSGNNCQGVWQTKGSIYEPKTDSWTPVLPPAGWTSIGDASGIVLADGTFFLSDCCSKKTAKFNPGNLSWTVFGTGFQAPSNDEAGWTLLPDGSLLTVDAAPANTLLTERFNSLTGVWSGAGNTPVSLVDNDSARGNNASFELGPAALRPNGTVFAVGANPNIGTACCAGSAHTAIFTIATSTWSAGPNVPGRDAANDAPSSVLPNGNVFFQAAPPLSATNVFGSPSHFYEFDGTSITQVDSPAVINYPSYVGAMLVLPTGQILFSRQDTDVEVYTSTGVPNPAWAPTISNVPTTLQRGQTYQATGTQFNGLTQGGYYGDDLQAATNYPLVRITNNATGHVFFARTHDHSSMGVATGNTPVSTSFDVSRSTENGPSTLSVVTNGIASAPVAVTITAPPARARFDFDGDGRSDISVFRPSTGSWYFTFSNNNGFGATQFGTGGDLIAPADFDGDGKADVSVFRPSTGSWYRLNSSNGAFVAIQFGQNGDVPVPGDFDGDAKADIAVFRASTGSWYRLNSSNGQFVGTQFGANGDRAQVGDFDGDGKTDLTVFRPSTGSWYTLRSSNGAFVATAFGQNGDVATNADFDGDGMDDIAVFRPSIGTFYRLNSSNGQFVPFQFGINGDVPAPADFDGDGKADVAVFRPSSGFWYEFRSTSGFLPMQFGANGDVATPSAFGQ
jgi:hypothetical protein